MIDQVGVITVFTIFRLLTDFVCLYNYEFWLALCKIVRSSLILFTDNIQVVSPFFSNVVRKNYMVNKGNNKINELRTILQRESQNS
jgi:hypothetical protein